MQSTEHAGRLRSAFALSLIARLPDGAIAPLMVLEARALGHSYAAGGCDAAAVCAGMSVGGPLVGRLSDRHGHAPVLLLSAVVAALALVGTGQASGPASQPLMFVCALLFGLTLPPVPAAVRAIWSRSLAPDQSAALLRLDAALQEIAWMLGPMLFTSLAAIASAPLAITAAAAATWLATTLFALSPEVRGAAPVQRPAHRRDQALLSEPGVKRLVTIAVAFGFGLGATELGVIASAGGSGHPDLTGMLFAAWSVGSFTAGMATARWLRAADPTRAILWLLVLLAVSTMALAVTWSLWTLALGLLVAGAGIAPLYATLNAAIAALAPQSRLTEAYAWMTGGVTAGLALGSAISALTDTPLPMFATAAAALSMGAAISAALTSSGPAGGSQGRG